MPVLIGLALLLVVLQPWLGARVARRARQRGRGRRRRPGPGGDGRGGGGRGVRRLLRRRAGRAAGRPAGLAAGPPAAGRERDQERAQRRRERGGRGGVPGGGAGPDRLAGGGADRRRVDAGRGGRGLARAPAAGPAAARGDRQSSASSRSCGWWQADVASERPSTSGDRPAAANPDVHRVLDPSDPLVARLHRPDRRRAAHRARAGRGLYLAESAQGDPAGAGRRAPAALDPAVRALAGADGGRRGRGRSSRGAGLVGRAGGARD